MSPNLHLTVVGGLNLDHVVRVSRFPRPGETVADGVRSMFPGGKGANQAVAAARLGAEVQLVGAVGHDETGRSLIAELRASGVDTAGVQLVDEPTGTALVLLDADGENSIVVCPGANARIDPGAVRVAANSALLAQFEGGLDVVERAALACSGLVVINPSPAQSLPKALLERADIFIVNEGEYEALPELQAASLVVRTLGARGAQLLRCGQVVHSVPGIATRVVNSVGAGDAFAAAFTVALLRGESAESALAIAVSVGAAAVSDERSQPRLGLLDEYRSSPHC